MAAAKPRSRRTAPARVTSKPRAKSAARTSIRKARRASAKRTPTTRSASARVTARRPVAKRPATKPPTATRQATKRAAARRPASKRVAPRRPAAKQPTPLELAPRVAAPAIPNAIGLMTQHLDFTSHDLEGVRRFYTELLGFSKYDHNPEFEYLSVSIAPNATIGFMPPMPGPPEQWRPPREPVLYFVVENVDQACAALAEKGVALDQPPTVMPWGDRAAMLRDPEGRMVWIAQHIQKG